MASIWACLAIVAANGLLMLATPRARLRARAAALRSLILCGLALAVPLVFRLSDTGAEMSARSAPIAFAPPVWFVGVVRVLLGEIDIYFLLLALAGGSAFVAAARGGHARLLRAVPPLRPGDGTPRRSARPHAPTTLSTPRERSTRLRSCTDFHLAHTGAQPAPPGALAGARGDGCRAGHEFAAERGHRRVARQRRASDRAPRQRHPVAAPGAGVLHDPRRACLFGDTGGQGRQLDLQNYRVGRLARAPDAGRRVDAVAARCRRPDSGAPAAPLARSRSVVAHCRGGRRTVGPDPRGTAPGETGGAFRSRALTCRARTSWR